MTDQPQAGPPATSPEPESGAELSIAPDLKIGEVRRGLKPGTRYVRVTRAAERPFLRTGATRWRATLAAQKPTTGTGRLMAAARRYIFGAPIASSMAMEERLSKLKALAIFSSDALSSSAYATEEILLALLLAGSGVLAVGLPISIAITVLLVVVVLSYQQTIKAYPRGGGTYSVASENLGKWPGLIAAAALLTDYVLTVAVSISAGALAIISAVPSLEPFRVEMAVAAIVLMAAGNLRGLREAGTIFAIPTYLFMLAFGGMLVVGFVRLTLGYADGASLSHSAPSRVQIEGVQTLTLFLVLRAFSSGSAALTGVEAIANGVQAFKPPESRNATITLGAMAAVLAVFFVGATFLAVRFGIVPSEDESVISQIGRMAFGGQNIPYYYLQATTALILVLAANTAFNGFPMLASILARDEFLPRQFAFRGDRLAYSNGILVLSTIAAALLVWFGADTHRLIPLYAIGVFVAFTLSQYGMVLRWRRLREKGWVTSATINGLGAVMTGIAAVVIAATKFMSGAWLVLILIPLLVAGLYLINRHYGSARKQLALAEGPLRLRLALTSDRPVVVPVSELNYATARAVAYARGISTNVTALHVITEEGEDTSEIEEQWQERYPDTPMIILESPYRSFLAPFIAYIDALTIAPDVPLTIILPEFVPARWWQQFLHNRTANRLRDALYRRPNTIVVSVTQQLE
jgi:amino acid transporter